MNSADLMKLEEAGLLDRVADLEKRSAEQTNELACLRSSMADCLRRISLLESSKGTALCQIRQSNMITHKRVSHSTDSSTFGFRRFYPI
ncbi:Echinoderm microtubule-associated protein 1 [Fasciola gigantica]|uniref:Echinoderm microtubule-associated protein 1 n=1 Tax=Fasciola gigantica TaxID=46835 RepID=A0A504YK08_FASGI|nr:Echinoderm microtubule-associated protein 1 [Fasciola gigantica]